MIAPPTAAEFRRFQVAYAAHWIPWCAGLPVIWYLGPDTAMKLLWTLAWLVFMPSWLLAPRATATYEELVRDWRAIDSSADSASLHRRASPWELIAGLAALVAAFALLRQNARTLSGEAFAASFVPLAIASLVMRRAIYPGSIRQFRSLLWMAMKSTAKILLTARMEELRSMDRASIEALPFERTDRARLPAGKTINVGNVNHVTGGGIHHVTTYVEEMGGRERKVVVQVGWTEDMPWYVGMWRRDVLVDMDGFVLQADDTKREMTDEETWDYW